MKSEILMLCDRLAAGAFNGLYQGVIVAVLVALVLRMLRRTNAATRHAVWFSTLLLMAGLIVAQCTRDHLAWANPFAKTDKATVVAEKKPGLGPITTFVFTPSQAEPVLVENGTTPSGRNWLELDSAAEKPLSGSERTFSTAGSLICADDNFTPWVYAPKEKADVAAASNQTSIGVVKEWLHRVANVAANPVSWKIALGTSIPGELSLLVLSAWLAIAGARMLMLIVRIRGVRRLKCSALPADEQLNLGFEKLRTRLAGGRKVELRVSPRHRSPVLLGFLHPVILLPANGTVEISEPVLRHELAHVCRRDDWANLVQQLIKAIFFFHPAVWWISRELTLEREIACDDHVLEQGGRPKAYALLLTDLAGRLHGGTPLLAPGVSDNKTQLQKRIVMILNTSRNTSPRLARTRLGLVTSAAVLLAVAAIYAAPRVVLAQSPTPRATAAAGGAPTAPVADAATAAAPATPLPEDVGDGPKFKPGARAITLPAPAISATPATPATPPAPGAPVALAVTPLPPLAPTAPVATVVLSGPATDYPSTRPARPEHVRVVEVGDGSMEERVARLERLVESLRAQRNQNPSVNAMPLWKSAPSDYYKNQSSDFPDKQNEFSHQWATVEPKQAQKLKEQADREAARAADQAKRADRDAKRADGQRQYTDKLRADSQAQLKALREQIRALERDREKLNREIQQLERDQEQLEREAQRSSNEAQPGRTLNEFPTPVVVGS
jgi:beta-lactamase regulating signal transducer with metallopeptidase domain